MSGFVNVALTFLATKHGLSITEASFLPAAQLLSQWLKWIWAPIVDITLSPKRWYLIGTLASAAGVFTLAAMPMTQDTLPALLAVVASASLLRSFVGMSLEAMLASVTARHEQGRTSAWFQVGNLGGAGLGGGLGLTLLEVMPEPWMAGAILATLFLLCALMLLAVPPIAAHRNPGGPGAAVKGVFVDIARLARSKGGILVTLLCFLPFGTGAAQGVLTQGSVAAHWGATATHVAWVQGYTTAVVTAVGCLVGGWMSTRLPARQAYVLQVLALAGAAAGLALTPATVVAYVAWNLIYAFIYGMVFAGWTVVILEAMGARSAATKYSLFASLSNFPNWWLGLVLGSIADAHGPVTMLLAEAGIGVVAIAGFLGAARLVARTRLPEELVEA
jgi:MFS family permease